MRRFSMLFMLNLTLTTVVSVHSTYAGKPAKAPQAGIYMKATQDASPKRCLPFLAKSLKR